METFRRTALIRGIRRRISSNDHHPGDFSDLEDRNNIAKTTAHLIQKSFMFCAMLEGTIR